MTDTLLSAALAYAAAGWPVFPCRPGSKEPFGGTKGCLDATTDQGAIAAWWARCPTANVAVATGTPGPDVLDFDVKDGRDGTASFDRLRNAGLLRGAHALVVTPSGGSHLYFAGTGQGNGKLTRPGVDFRARGGYVLAPPSQVDGRLYELAEHRPATGATVDFAAVRRLLDPPPAVPRRNGGRTAGGGALARWVAGQPVGNRNDALHWAACTALESGVDDLDDLADAARSAGLGDLEVARTIASARRRVAVR